MGFAHVRTFPPRALSLTPVSPQPRLRAADQHRQGKVPGDAPAPACGSLPDSGRTPLPPRCAGALGVLQALPDYVTTGVPM